MSLGLEYRWEHALLAATIAAAEERHPDFYLGRTALQKLVYFLQVRGVPMRYSFRIYNFGPFCDDIPGALEWLQVDEVVQDKSDKARYSNYRASQGWEELREKFAEDLASHQATIDEVVEAMGGLTPDQLELIATLDFCFRWVRAAKPCGPWKEATTTKFKQIKKDKFADSDIDRWYDALVDSQLIEG